MKPDVFKLIEEGLNGHQISERLKADGATPQQIVQAAAEYAKSLTEDTLHRNRRAAYRGDSRREYTGVYRIDASNPLPKVVG